MHIFKTSPQPSLVAKSNVKSIYKIIISILPIRYERQGTQIPLTNCVDLEVLDPVGAPGVDLGDGDLDVLALDRGVEDEVDGPRVVRGQDHHLAGDAAVEGHLEQLVLGHCGKRDDSDDFSKCLLPCFQDSI